MSFGKLFLSAILAEKSVASFVQYGSIDHLFKASEEPVFEFVKAFVKQYQALPSPETIEAHTGETLLPHSEPSGYYHDMMVARHTEYALRQGLKKAHDLLLPENKDAESALAAITETVMALIADKHQKQVVDFREAYELVIGTYKAKLYAKEQMGLHLGWPTVDEMTGGLGVGDVTSMVGRPAAGKTWQMLFAALHGWRLAGETFLQTGQEPDTDQSRMFVSMEMGVLPINQRLAAMQSHQSASNVKKSHLGSVGYKALKKGLNEIKGYPHPFYVVDGNLAATVEDLWMLARQLKPAAIFIDGAYLVKHPSERDRFRRVAENADLIKQELAAIAPTVCSWQFARSATKKNKKGEKADLDDIGYTDAIGQVSSLVMGLFEEESVETLKQRKVKILKGRNGEVGAFSTRWNFSTMDFTEIVDDAPEDLQFF